MKMQIGRWGNSLAVRLPKSLADRFRLNEGDEFDSAALEAALETLHADEMRKSRRLAIEEIAQTGWSLPENWQFDREEANAR
jgi:antitoxin MazE